jgi:X-X-X-Leu-X-X-Gly heptad repeat protein
MTTGAERRRPLLPTLGVVAAVVLVGAGVSALVVPPPAETPAPQGPPLENDEVVLATLDPSGLPEEAFLVSTVTARGGETRLVEDPASTVNVGYVNRRGSPETGDGVVLVEVGGPGTTSVVTQATFDKPLPVALHAEYRLDGEVVAPEDVLGSEGDLVVRYTVTNTTAQSTSLRYTDAAGQERSRDVPVFVPFAGTLTVTLPGSLELVDPGAAAQATDAGGRTLLRYSLLLAPPLGSFQQEAVLTARTADGATPSATLGLVPSTSDTDPATEFSASALSGSAEGNVELVEGLGELSEQTGLLADGATDVADGGAAVASGATVLADQVTGPLRSGSEALRAGAAELAAGSEELASGLAASEPGARRLAAGADRLAAGLDRLAAGLAELAGPSGLPAAATAAGDLQTGAAAVADALGSAGDGPWPPPGTLPPLPDLPALPPDLTEEELRAVLDDVRDRLEDLSLEDLPDDVPPPTLVQSLRLLQQATDLLTQVTGLLVVGSEDQPALLREATRSASAAASDAAALYAEVCAVPAPPLTPGQCDRLASVAADAAAAATAAAKAQLLTGLLGAGLVGIEQALAVLEEAVAELSAAVRSGERDEPGLVEGLALLEEGLRVSARGAQTLSAGVAGSAAAADGLADGAGGLAAGLGQASVGADQLASGADALAAGTAAQADGVAALGSGADELALGARQAARGSEEVAAGVEVLQSEGIDEAAAAVVAASRDPALAAAWLAATDERAADALPYGPPDGAVGRAAYQLSMAATQPAGTPAWQWWALGLVAAGGTAWGVRQRLRA